MFSFLFFEQYLFPNPSILVIVILNTIEFWIASVEK